MHGTVAAVAALQKSDLLICLGARFDDRVTGKLDSFAPERQGHPRRHRPGRDRQEPHGRRADRRRLPRGDRRPDRARSRPSTRPGGAATTTAWWQQVDGWRTTYPLGYDRPTDGSLAPQYVIERLGEIAGPDALYVAGVGQHQMWAAQFIKYENPGTWLNSGGLGTMGYAVPAAMGAKVGRPDAHGLGDRRRRLLPDDQPGAGHLRDRGHPDQGRHHQQRQPRHGPAVADAVLRRALLQHRPAHGRASGSRTS